MVLTRFSLNVSLVTGVHYQLPAAISCVLTVSQKPWRPMDDAQSAGRRSLSRMPSNSIFEIQHNVRLFKSIIKMVFFGSYRCSIDEADKYDTELLEPVAINISNKPNYN